MCDIYFHLCGCICVYGDIVVCHAALANLSPPSPVSLPSSYEQYGWTALILASLKGQVDVVKHLLDNGASVDIQDKVRDVG